MIAKTKIKNLYISPQIGDTKTQPANLFVILKDIKITEENLGRIKNVLSQKIIIFSNENNTLSDEAFFKLGFINEFNDKKRKLKCFSYNLKTYNIGKKYEILDKIFLKVLKNLSGFFEIAGQTVCTLITGLTTPRFFLISE